MNRLPLLITASLLLSNVAQATPNGPSFDCGKAQTSVEKAICASPSLAFLDLNIEMLYAWWGPPSGVVQEEQRRWLATRDRVCSKTSDGNLPSGPEQIQACLESTLSMRVSALAPNNAVVFTSCKRAETVLSISRMADNTPSQDDLDMQLLKAGLLYPTPKDKPLTPAWRKRLALANDRFAIDGRITQFSPNYGSPYSYALVSQSGNIISCENPAFYAIDPKGKVQEIPYPENIDVDRCKLLRTSAWMADINPTGPAMVLVVSERNITTPNLRYYVLRNGKWEESCQITAVYTADYHVTADKCELASSICEALRKQLPAWISIVAHSGWIKGDQALSSETQFPILPDTVVIDQNKNLGNIYSFINWKNIQYDVNESGPIISWTNSASPIIMRITQIGKSSEDKFILTAWRDSDTADTLPMAAAFLIEKHRIAVQSVKGASSP